MRLLRWAAERIRRFTSWVRWVIAGRPVYSQNPKYDLAVPLAFYGGRVEGLRHRPTCTIDLASAYPKGEE